MDLFPSVKHYYIDPMLVSSCINFNLFRTGTVFKVQTSEFDVYRRQNLKSKDVPALKELKMCNGRRPMTSHSNKAKIEDIYDNFKLKQPLRLGLRGLYTNISAS